jgi:multiple sugar transport system ATP-binding protein
MASRIVVMKDGIVQQVDTPEEVYNNPSNTFVASFIGSPPMNFIDGRLEERQDGKVEFHTSRFSLEIPQGKAKELVVKRLIDKVVTLGVRPENISVEQIVFDAFPHAVVNGIHKFNELMGADRFLHLDIGGPNMLVVRTSPRNDYADEMKVAVAFDMNKTLFFDRDSGARLTDS